MKKPLTNMAASVRDRLKILRSSTGQEYSHRGHVLCAAAPDGLSEVFWNDASRQSLWRSFWNKSVRIDPMPPFPEVASFASSFLLPPMMAAAQEQSFTASWKPGGPWEGGAE